MFESPCLKGIFFDNPELEEISESLNELELREVIARNLLKILLHSECQNLQTTLKTVQLVLGSILMRKDPNGLFILRKETNQIFQHAYKKISNITLPKAVLELLDLSIANLLSYYVFFEPNPFDETLTIPRKIDNRYHLVEYKIEPIEITPASRKVIKHKIKDDERVFAYGLTPVNNRFANRILVFCGTTFPVGQGSKTQLIMNLYPYTSLGEHYDWEKIKAWIFSRKDHIGIDVCGASQGGGLSLLLGLMFPEKIRRIDAMNPPGLLKDYDESCGILGAWDRAKKNNKACPEVFIQSQVGDPVPKVGFWKPDWNILKLKINSNDNWLIWGIQQSIFGMHPAFHSAHILNFAGIPNVQIEKYSGEQDNTPLRYLRTQSIMNIGRRVLYGIINAYQSFFTSDSNDKAQKKTIGRTCLIHQKKYLQTIKSNINLMSKSKSTFTLEHSEKSFLPYLNIGKEQNKMSTLQSENTNQISLIEENHPITFWM